jgi:hypothetical protein
MKRNFDIAVESKQGIPGVGTYRVDNYYKITSKGCNKSWK